MDQDDLRAWATAHPRCALAKLLQEADLSKSLSNGVNGKITSTLSCKRCRTENPLVWQRQTRSADEAMTVFYMCKNPECGARWRE
jgi:DNA-directed RNA polymerase subunit M/transcription elongation factor TFIIS